MPGPRNAVDGYSLATFCDISVDLVNAAARQLVDISTSSSNPEGVFHPCVILAGGGRT